MKAVASDRRRELSAIHAAATQLGMDTSDPSPGTEYRSLIARLAGGKTSAADLDARQRQAVIRELQCLLGRHGQRPADGWHAEHMRRLWQQLGQAGALQDPTERGLLAFVKAQVGRDALRFLTTREGNRIVEALKAWLARHQQSA